MPADFKVQHFELTAQATTDFDIESDLGGEAVDTTYTVVSVPNLLHAGTGRAVVDTTALTNRNLGCRMTLRDSGATLRVTLDGNHEAVDHTYFVQLIEYVGPAGGPNEWIVRTSAAIRMLATVTTNSTAIAGVVDNSKLVPFCSGISSTLASRAWSQAASRLTVSGASIVATRGGSSGTVQVQVQGVELTGSEWSVQQNQAHTFAVAGDLEAFTFGSPVQSWGAAFALVYHQIEPGENGMDEVGYHAYARATDKTGMTVELEAGADLVGSGYILAAHVLENPTLQVYHADSDAATKGSLLTRLTGLQSDESQSPVGLNAPVGESWVIPRGWTQGANTAYPGPFWGCQLVGRDTLRFRRGRTIGAGQVTSPAVQVVRMPRTDAPTEFWGQGEGRGVGGVGNGR